MSFALTTADNPFHPVDEFDSWWSMDRALGHDTLGHLARIARTSSELSDEMNEEIVDEAIQFIIENDLESKYRIVRIDEEQTYA